MMYLKVVFLTTVLYVLLRIVKTNLITDHAVKAYNFVNAVIMERIVTQQVTGPDANRLIRIVQDVLLSYPSYDELDNDWFKWTYNQCYPDIERVLAEELTKNKLL